MTGTSFTNQESTNHSSLQVLLTAADAALNGTVKLYFALIGADGYLVFDDDGIGISNIVKLNGVTTISDSDFFTGVTGVIGGGG